VISGTTRLVGLIGRPVSDSLSPRMQNAAFAARGLDWAYVPLPVEESRVEAAVAGLVALRLAGANVTAPYKTRALAFCDELDEVATRARSVNTLVIDDERVVGSSTDAEALERIDASSAAVVGSGGAASAWIGGLEARGISAQVFGRSGRWPPETEAVDLVVHATPVRDELLFEPLRGQTIVDLAYSPDGRDTALIVAARAAGCTVVDGLEVLVLQGAASFERWTGVPAPVDVMRAALRFPA